MDCTTMRRGWVLFFICMSVLLVPASNILSEVISQRIDGKVVRTDESKRTIVIDSEIPATGERIQKEFVILENTGFKDFKRLSDLKSGDLVSLDYLDEKPLPKAMYIMHIPLEKTYFTPKEIAQAILKIKPQGTKQHASKN